MLELNPRAEDVPGLSEKAKALEEYCGQNNRICPNPIYWNELWEMLPKNHTCKDERETPPLPLILAAWWEFSDFQKHQRLVTHIRWADEFGGIDSVDHFLRGLTEDKWFHQGE